MAKKQPESAEDSAGRAKEKKLSKDKIKKKDRKEKKGKKKDAKHKLLEAAVEGDGEEDMEMVEDVDGPETAPKDVDVDSPDAGTAAAETKSDAKLQREASEQLMGDEMGTSSSGSEKKQNRKGKQPREPKTKDADTPDKPAEAATGSALFFVDTTRTKVDPAAVKPKPNGVQQAPRDDRESALAGLNRPARRRLQLIDRQRGIIRKALVKEGTLEADSAEFLAELEDRLAKWTEMTDEKTGAREAKKKERKARDSRRQREKRGKLAAERKQRVKDEQTDEPGKPQPEKLKKRKKKGPGARRKTVSAN